jgi:hypothetical protein
MLRRTLDLAMVGRVPYAPLGARLALPGAEMDVRALDRRPRPDGGLLGAAPPAAACSIRYGSIMVLSDLAAAARWAWPGICRTSPSSRLSDRPKENATP